MSAKLITYDLCAPGRDYTSLIVRLQQYPIDCSFQGKTERQAIRSCSPYFNFAPACRSASSIQC